jgi:hypothetical protein
LDTALDIAALMHSSPQVLRWVGDSKALPQTEHGLGLRRFTAAHSLEQVLRTDDGGALN